MAYKLAMVIFVSASKDTDWYLGALCVQFTMFLLWRRHLLTILSISALGVAMNRPVYKIILNSKGYAQFIQYDIDVAPLREFTLCVWVRVTSLEDDQTIFTYVGTDGKRIMRLWLDSGGRQLKLSLERDRVTSTAAVEFAAGVWRDVCVSYQADHGAWALYVDAKLLLCEGLKKFRGWSFSGKGSLIIGYGISEKGFPTGLSGEIYGASMILFSTIDRNTSLKGNSWIKQKNRHENHFTARSKEEKQYIVLGDLQRAEIQTSTPPTKNNAYEIYTDITNFQFKDDYNSIFAKSPHVERNNKKEYDILVDENRPPNDKDGKINYKQLYKNKFKLNYDLKKELTGSGTQDLPIVLEYETPPPITASTTDYSVRNSDRGKSSSSTHYDDIIISEVEKPPPPEHNTKVYGQWTGTQFASNVLNYLKSINFNTNKKQKQIVPTFPVGKLSDSYPYPSEFKHTIIRPTINYKRKRHNTDGRHIIVRRDNKEHQINLQIVDPFESDLNIHLKNVDPKLVEVTNRGEAKKVLKSLLYISADDSLPNDTEETSNLRKSPSQTQNFDSIINPSERHRGTNLMNIVPYLKSKEYFVTNEPILDGDELTQTKRTKHNQRLLYHELNNDPWNNVYQNMANLVNKKNNESKSNQYKQSQAITGDAIGRALAKEVSNKAKQDTYNIPFLKYKLGPRSSSMLDDSSKQEKNKNNFNKQVKLGNALNEQFITGFDVHQIKNTFLGGNDSIPDINRHRSKSNLTFENIPASLEARVCQNVELYVSEDESISKSKISSPISRNTGIEFVIQHYKKCAMEESFPKDNPYVLIDWMSTPVKLYGGAYTKKTKDLCGFF